MEQQKNLYHTIITSRLKGILALLKKGNQTMTIEREVATLALDVLEAMPQRFISPKEGGKYFIQIDYALSPKREEKMSEAFRDLINEAILLDEAGTAYGPDLALMRSLAGKILARDEATDRQQLRKFMSTLKTSHKSTRMPVAAV